MVTDLGANVTDLEYHGQIGARTVSRLSQTYTLRRPGYQTIKRQGTVQHHKIYPVNRGIGV